MKENKIFIKRTLKMNNNKKIVNFWISKNKFRQFQNCLMDSFNL